MLEELNRVSTRSFDACTSLVYKIDGLNIKNNIELIERLTPFFYYLVSTYLRENGPCNLLTAVDVYFPHQVIYHFNNSHLRLMHFCVGSINQVILEILKNMKKYYIDEGYHITFTKPVTLIIWLKRSGVFGEGYIRDIIPRNLQSTPDYSEEKESKEEMEEYREEEEQIINTHKSFKSDECVIC